MLRYKQHSVFGAFSFCFGYMNKLDIINSMNTVALSTFASGRTDSAIFTGIH